jgi:hypothetical protein
MEMTELFLTQLSTFYERDLFRSMNSNCWWKTPLLKNRLQGKHSDGWFYSASNWFSWLMFSTELPNYPHWNNLLKFLTNYVRKIKLRSYAGSGRLGFASNCGRPKEDDPKCFWTNYNLGSTAGGAELNWPTLPQKTSSKEEITESYSKLTQ